MGESDRYIDHKGAEKKSAGSELLQNPLMGLVIAHAVFFLTLLIIQMFNFSTGTTPADFEKTTLSFFRLPSSWQAFLHQPWSLLTYIFTDTGDSVWRLISNLLWMSAFGFFLLEQQEGNQIIPAYLYGAFVSGVSFILFSSFADIDQPVYLSGAQGAVMSLAVAATTYYPGHRFFRHIGRGIPVWVMLILFVFIDFSSVAYLPPSYFISHVAGGLTGWGYMYLNKKGMDAGKWMHGFYDQVIHLFSPKSTKKQEAVKSRNFYHTGGRAPYKKEIKLNEDRLNALLEKIHRDGYDALTNEEKALLKKASESDDTP